MISSAALVPQKRKTYSWKIADQAYNIVEIYNRNHDEEYLQEHDHESETRNSFSPPQSHGRRVRFRNQYKEYQQEQDYEVDFVQTGTYMSDDEEDNIGSTSHGMFTMVLYFITPTENHFIHAFAY
jgi:hypothetical protein